MIIRVLISEELLTVTNLLLVFSNEARQDIVSPLNFESNVVGLEGEQQSAMEMFASMATHKLFNVTKTAATRKLFFFRLVSMVMGMQKSK